MNTSLPLALSYGLHADRWSEPSTLTLTAKRFTPSKLAVLLDLTLEIGLDPGIVLAETGLDAEAVRNPFTLTSPLQFLTAARNAVRACPETDLGLRVGAKLHATSYGMFGYALLCSETFGHAVDMGVRYHRLANGMLPVRWTREGDLMSWTFPDPDFLKLPELDDALYRFLVELQFAVHVTLLKDVMGPWCTPVRASFAFAEPAHAARTACVLECPALFDQPQHALSYLAAWLPKAPQMANPVAAAQISAECAKLMEELRRQAGIAQRVCQELSRTPGLFPGIDAIATTLHMTTRTLRRKLEAEGTSYSELLASVRKALAIDYLSTTSLSTEDIASNLGFSDSVSFRHAFRRWTGKSPREFRTNRSAPCDGAEPRTDGAGSALAAS